MAYDEQTTLGAWPHCVIDYQFLTFASASPDCAITIAVTAPKKLTVFRSTQRRTLQPWHGSDPGAGGVGTQRLPPRIPTPTNPTTLRWRALSSRKAQSRTVRAAVAMPTTAQT